MVVCVVLCMKSVDYLLCITRCVFEMESLVTMRINKPLGNHCCTFTLCGLEMRSWIPIHEFEIFPMLSLSPIFWKTCTMLPA